ncbi:MAG: flagellin lysine-N-methylase, partial [Schwartzia sp.]|nr:flagellin lysine-N-methylase [Schwartzia sp. (in: firmicutes)]
KTWGADWLSNTCTMYPRMMYMAGELLVLALTLTCPLAAKLALLPKEPMSFEKVPLAAEQKEEMVSRCAGRLSMMGDALLDLQYGAISILQNRALSIDQRLIVLGFFLDQAGDMVESGTPEQIETLAAVYTADDFMERVPEMLRAIDFREAEYVKSMFGLIETLYGKDAEFQGREQPLMYHVVHAFGVKNRDVPLSELVETYRKIFRPAQEQLLREFGHIFENYLVNEFFLEHYPQRIAGTLTQNYILFVMTYKLLEFIAVSMAVAGKAQADESETGEMDAEKVVELIEHMVASFDHSTDFLISVAKDALKRHKDVVACMKNLLYTGEELPA